MEMEATVDEVSLSLNSEDVIGDLIGSQAPPTLTGKPALRKLKSLIDAGASPDVLQLVHVTASQVGLNLTMSPDTAIVMRLDALLNSIRCPVHSPPADDTFEMVVPVNKDDSGVVVHITKEAAGSLPDITVESSPVVFEFRNQVLLQSVDYIDRCIIGAFAPLRSGPKPPSQPLWRVLVPSARMLMPTGGHGVVEFVVGDASVCNTVEEEPSKTQVIHVTAAKVSAYITRERDPSDTTPDDERLPKPTSPRHRVSPLPLFEELSSSS